MIRSELIDKAYKVDTDDEKLSFVSTFDTLYDIEIVATLSAWVSNDVRGENYTIQSFVSDVMENKPTDYISTYVQHNSCKQLYDSCFFRVLTDSNLHNLLNKFYKIWCCWGGLQNVFETNVMQVSFAHEALAMCLSGNTGFPTARSNGTNYRFNLLLYWLAYKLEVWYDPWAFLDSALLPCSDEIFARAYMLGVVDKPMKSTLQNTILLTNKARDWFGDRDFYKMYELLKFYKE